MANTLFKESRITGEPGTAGSPEIPARPGSPGYWTTITDSSGAARQAALNLLNAQRQAGLITDGEYVAALATLPPQTTTTRVFVPGTAGSPATPGIPATESTLVTDLNIGWNAGARSIQEEKGPFDVEFTFSQGTVAAKAGINNTQDLAADIHEILWGFNFAEGLVSVWEINEQGVGESIGTTPSAVSDGAVFKISRDGTGEITYYIDAALVHTSTRLCFGTAFLEGILYSADG